MPETFMVHRYTFTIPEAIEHLVGEAVQDCERMELRLDGDAVVVDIFDVVDGNVTALVNEVAARATEAAAPAAKEEEKPKGGPLAKRAAIMCGEPGFWTFLRTQRKAPGVNGKEDAAAWLRWHCDVESRALIDSDKAAAERFDEVEKAYKLWLEGY